MFSVIHPEHAGLRIVRHRDEKLVVQLTSRQKLYDSKGREKLEITAQEPEGLISQVEGLLGAIQWEPGFEVPLASGGASEGIAAAKAPLPRLYGPYLYRGMEEWEIQAELARIRTESPGLDLAGATRRLSELHPELFVTEAEMRQMMTEPLSGLQTGIYEEEKGGGYKLHVPAIGSTQEVG